MKKKILFLVAIAVLVIGSFTSPSTSHALTINQISVTVGGVTWCDTTTIAVGCTAANHIWNLGLGGANLGNGGIALVLTQNQPGVGTGGFNFDSSERGGAQACNTLAPGASCTTALIINNVPVPLSAATTANSALANFNLDCNGISNTTTCVGNGAAHNEAANWNGTVANTGSGGLSVWFGYADTAHTDACADTTGTVIGNCRPDSPWLGEVPPGGTSTIFLGSAFAGGPTSCLRQGITSCFDAGAIRIEANGTAPEPSTMFLLGVGLVGLAAWGRKRQNTPKK